jgi:PIN domain nuclease of toxin-antitoxin system
MIIDTTYLLPLARIGIETDFLRAVADGSIKVNLDFNDLKVNLISIFELQAKASRLDIPPEDILRAKDIIFRAFKVIPFYESDIIKEASKLNRTLGDYIDSIIVATAITLGEDLLTEDSIITRLKNSIRKEYGIEILSYRDVVNHPHQ